jgi:hypothetical protein
MKFPVSLSFATPLYWVQRLAHGSTDVGNLGCSLCLWALRLNFNLGAPSVQYQLKIVSTSRGKCIENLRKDKLLSIPPAGPRQLIQVRLVTYKQPDWYCRGGWFCRTQLEWFRTHGYSTRHFWLWLVHICVTASQRTSRNTSWGRSWRVYRADNRTHLHRGERTRESITKEQHRTHLHRAERIRGNIIQQNNTEHICTGQKEHIEYHTTEQHGVIHDNPAQQTVQTARPRFPATANLRTQGAQCRDNNQQYGGTLTAVKLRHYDLWLSFELAVKLEHLRTKQTHAITSSLNQRVCRHCPSSTIINN